MTGWTAGLRSLWVRVNLWVFALTTGAAMLTILPLLTSVAEAARLATPKQAKALRAAFEHEKGHKGAVIVAITTSTADKGYAAVAYLRSSSQAKAAASGPKVIVVHKFYSDQPGNSPKPIAKPPKKAKDDLSKDFWISIVYQGSGSEDLKAQYNGNSCQSDIITNTATVKPATWRYEYRIDLDKAINFSESKDGSYEVDPLVRVLSQPNEVSVAVSDNRTEQITSNGLDGCGNVTYVSTATSAFQGTRNAFPGVVAFTDRGLEVEIPSIRSTCDPAGPFNLCLQPIATAWALNVGASVAVQKLGFTTVYQNTNTPINVSEKDTLQNVTPVVCQGAMSCSDTFEWNGTVEVINR